MQIFQFPSLFNVSFSINIEHFLAWTQAQKLTFSRVQKLNLGMSLWCLMWNVSNIKFTILMLKHGNCKTLPNNFQSIWPCGNLQSARFTTMNRLFCHIHTVHGDSKIHFCNELITFKCICWTSHHWLSSKIILNYFQK